MFFKIDKKILATNDGIYTGVVIVEGIDNKKESAGIHEILQNEVRIISESFADKSVKGVKELDLYSRLGELYFFEI